MSIEQYPKHEQDPFQLESQLPIEALELQHGEVALLDKVMVDQEQAREKWGINGDVLGVIELPVNTESQDYMMPPEGEGFQIAVVDYGEDFSQKLLYGDIKVFGSARARYGLLALNYRNPMEGSKVVYSAMSSDEMTVGRNDHDLSLDGGYESLKAISREHFTMRVGADGLQIEDRSTNGTKLFRPPETVYEAVEQGVEESITNFGGAVTKTAEQLVDADVEPRTVAGLGSTGLKGALIDDVPKTGEQAAQMMAGAEAAKQAERQREIDQHLNQLEDGAVELLEGLSDTDRQSIQMYANAMLNKADAQHFGHGDESIYYGQVAGQAFGAMSELARSRADNYLRQQRKIVQFSSM